MAQCGTRCISRSFGCDRHELRWPISGDGRRSPSRKRPRRRRSSARARRSVPFQTDRRGGAGLRDHERAARSPVLLRMARPRRRVRICGPSVVLSRLGRTRPRPLTRGESHLVLPLEPRLPRNRSGGNGIGLWLQGHLHVRGESRIDEQGRIRNLGRSASDSSVQRHRLRAAATLVQSHCDSARNAGIERVLSRRYALRECRAQDQTLRYERTAKRIVERLSISGRTPFLAIRRTTPRRR